MLSGSVPWLLRKVAIGVALFCAVNKTERNAFRTLHIASPAAQRGFTVLATCRAPIPPVGGVYSRVLTPIGVLMTAYSNQ